MTSSSFDSFVGLIRRCGLFAEVGQPRQIAPTDARGGSGRSGAARWASARMDRHRVTSRAFRFQSWQSTAWYAKGTTVGGSSATSRATAAEVPHGRPASTRSSSAAISNQYGW